MRVGISSDYFAKELRAYDNWRWAWVRELGQNAIDARSKTIKFTISAQPDGNTLAIAENDGPPMDQEILLNKFLCLGGTTKEGTDSVGGFGIAKTVIALAHNNYKIETGNFCVTGSGGDFDLVEQEYFPGTRTSIVIKGNNVERLECAARLFSYYAQWGGSYFVNGKELDCGLNKGSRRTEFDWGVVYTNNSYENTLIVRMHGIPMFFKSISSKKCVLVELSKNSSDVLTSNRDSLVYPYSGQLNDFVVNLAVDHRKAFRVPVPTIEVYDGFKFAHTALSVEEITEEATEAKEENQTEEDKTENVTVNTSSDDVIMELSDRTPSIRNSIVPAIVRPHTHRRQKFIIKNETGLQTPDYLAPSNFSHYSFKLLQSWNNILRILHKIFNRSAIYSTGFILSETCEAMFENGDEGVVYYINPLKVVKQKNSESRSFTKRFKLTDKNKLISLATHELVHGAGFQWHDEDFAGHLTDYIKVVLDRRKEFNGS